MGIGNSGLGGSEGLADGLVTVPQDLHERYDPAAPAPAPADVADPAQHVYDLPGLQCTYFDVPVSGVDIGYGGTSGDSRLVLEGGSGLTHNYDPTTGTLNVHEAPSAGSLSPDGIAATEETAGHAWLKLIQDCTGTSHTVLAGSGDVGVSGVEVGKLSIYATTGSVAMHSLTLVGDARVVTTSGEISVSDVTAPGREVALDTKSGALRVDGGSAALLRADTVSGSIAIHDYTGRIELSTASGQVDIRPLSADGQ